MLSLQMAKFCIHLHQKDEDNNVGDYTNNNGRPEQTPMRRGEATKEESTITPSLLRVCTSQDVDGALLQDAQRTSARFVLG